MRTLIRLVPLVALALVTAAIAQPSEPLVSRLIVKFRADAQKSARPKSARVALLAAHSGVALSHAREMALGMDVVRLDSARTMTEARAIAARIAAEPDVEFAEVDLPMSAKLVPNDEFIFAQFYLSDSATSIGAYSAWDVTTGSPSTVIAVIDTGIRPHADLAGRIVPGWDFVSNVMRAGDGDGRDPDPSDPGDFVTQADIDAGLTGADCTPHNSSWHGTMVAGVIGANGNNAQWTAGIDWAARIEPLRALGKCGGSSADVTDAIAWAAGLPVPGTAPNAYPADVINLSLGGQADCPFSYANVIAAALATGRVRAIVAAAGNEDTGSIDTPANCPGVIAAVSTTRAGKRARYSNYGALATIAAPGGQPSPSSINTGIYTLSNAGVQDPGPDSVANVGGTSFAAPMVAGTAALVLAVAPNMTADAMRTLLTSTAKPFPDGSDCTTTICGAGIVDAGNAVRAAVASAPPANYEGLWWNSAESGWGINLAHQGDRIYLTWYTYDANGKSSWIAMLAAKTAPGTYTGDLLEFRGPPFDASPFAPAPTYTIVGTGTLSFADTANGTFSYTAKGVTQQEPITRYPFAAPPPACTYGTAPDFASATNYQDLWWDAAENGWGINLAHQGAQIYATWYTYDTDGSPLWLAALMNQSGPATFSGALFRTTGPSFGAPWNPAAVHVTPLGNATLSFANGNAATWSYTAGVAAGNKAMTRYLFAAPAGTVCH